MLKINEELLQFIWQNKIIGKTKFYSINNTEIDVIDFGAKNNDSGPDFFNGKIKLNNIILVGNIEIHVKTSDWNKHKHYNDSAYNNIILHVVFEHDKNIQQNIQFQLSAAGFTTKTYELKVLPKPTLKQFNL